MFFSVWFVVLKCKHLNCLYVFICLVNISKHLSSKVDVTGDVAKVLINIYTHIYIYIYIYVCVCVCVCVYAYTYLIYMMYHHHHHHVVPQARISLTLPLHLSLQHIAFDRSSKLHPVCKELLSIGSSWTSNTC